MSAIETVNLVNFMVSFSAADPPVVIAKTPNVRDVSRSATGTYLVELVEKITTGGAAAPGQQLQCSSQDASATTTVSAIELSGDVFVRARDLAGAAADTGARIDIVCLNYPVTD